MKLRLLLLMLGVAGILGAGRPDAQAATEVSVGFQISSPAEFDAPLAPYGSWVDVAGYGRCWRPTQVAADWEPYTEGYWEWTDYGWYWVSEEPWAWACYHYGSWINDPNYSWCWLPGVEWAPSWVVWRESPEYIGWAPCGPSGVVVAPEFFVFAGVNNFHHHRYHRHDLIVNNPTIINRTRVINNVRTETRSIDGRSHRIAVNLPGHRAGATGDGPDVHADADAGSHSPDAGAGIDPATPESTGRATRSSGPTHYAT